jgi:LPXTG-motif cell wall-anchored protein
MNKIMTRAAETALAAGVAGGVLLLGSAAASAQEAPTTAEGNGFVAGNAVNTDVDAPVTLCGIAGSLLGVATGVCENPPVPPPTQDTTVAQASGNGFGTGNAVGLDVDAPVTVCGVGVVGALVGTGVCEGAPPAAPAAGGGDTTVAQAEGNGFIAGNALGIDLDVPITVCGVGAAGAGVATGTCEMAPPPPGGGGGLGDVVTAQASGNGFLTGNAIGLNVDLPINICGVGVAVIGIATGDCSMPAGAPLATTGPDQTSSTAEGNGFLAGNAIAGDLDVPVTVCGVGVAGIGVGTGVCEVGAPPPPCKDECPPPCDDDCPPPPCKEDCPPPPCKEDCPPPPCKDDCPPPPPCTSNCPPPPHCTNDCPPPPPPHRGERHPMAVAHHGGGVSGQLPRTGGTTDVALPVGAGLIAAGMAFLAAARRRLASVTG